MPAFSLPDHGIRGQSLLFPDRLIDISGDFCITLLQLAAVTRIRPAAPSLKPLSRRNAAIYNLHKTSILSI